MSRLLIIGCGGVAGVAIHKCCQNSDVFTEICIASRTKSKCDAIKAKLENTTKTVITTAQVNADSKDELVALINSYKPDAVLNLALPYQDLTIMDACLEPKQTTLIRQTMNRRTQQTPNGKPFMKSAAKTLALPLTLIIRGSGHIKKSLKKQVSQHFWVQALTRALQAYLQHMRSSIILMKSVI